MLKKISPAIVLGGLVFATGYAAQNLEGLVATALAVATCVLFMVFLGYMAMIWPDM